MFTVIVLLIALAGLYLGIDARLKLNFMNKSLIKDFELQNKDDERQNEYAYTLDERIEKIEKRLDRKHNP